MVCNNIAIERFKQQTRREAARRGAHRTPEGGV